MGQKKETQKALKDFDTGESSWFRSYEPLEFEEDGQHSLNGLPRELTSLPVSTAIEETLPMSSQQLPWASVACFGLVGLTLIALLATYTGV